MEFLVSIARGVREPWRSILTGVMGALRVTFYYLERGAFRAFVNIAHLHDILKDDF